MSEPVDDALARRRTRISWLKPPTTPDRELAARARLLHAIFWITILGSGTGALVFPFFYARWLEAIVVNVGIVIVTLPFLAMLMRGEIERAGRIFGAASLFIVLSSVVNSGGITSPAVLILPAAVLVTGFVNGPRAAILGTVTLVVCLLLIGIAERRGIVRPPVEGFTVEEIWLSFSVSLFATGGVVYASVGALRRALESAESSESRLAELIEQSPDGILAIEPDGTIVHANAAASAILPAPEGGLVSTSIFALEGLDAAGRDALRARIEGAGEGDGDVLLLARGADRDERHLRARVRRVADQAASRVQITLRDDTERTRAERERRRLESELAQSQKLHVVGQLAGGVAHDFNNYLTIIRTCADSLRNRNKDDAKQAQLVLAIGEASERAADLTRQLLALSRKHVLQPRDLDLVDLLTSSERMIRHAMGPKVELAFVSDAEVVPVHADPAQLEVVLLNLVVNARDAMLDGGVLTIESGTAHVDEEQASRLGLPKGRHAVLRVADSGVGMDEATLARAREPFFSTKGSRGTGLGLSTVDAIVQQSGGFLEIESRSESGTRVSVYLPLAEGRPLTLGRPAPAPAVGGTERVLLVEDQNELRVVTETLLVQHGYRVTSFESAEGALACFEQAPRAFDVVLSDVRLPGMDGFELVARVRGVAPGMAALLVSGFTDDAERTSDPDRPRVLAKPYTATRLLRELRSVIDASERVRSDPPSP